MKKILLFLLLSNTFFLLAKDPAWVLTLGGETQVDETKYLTGFGIDENYEQAKVNALQDASAKIKTTIHSQIELYDEEKNGETLSIAKSNIQATVHLNISGIKEYQKFYDRQQKKYYALCIIDKAAFYSQLDVDRKTLTAEFENQKKIIDELLKKNSIEKSIEQYQQINSIVEKLNQNYLMANFIKDGKENLDPLYQILRAKGELEAQIKIKEIRNMDDAIESLFQPFDKMSFSQAAVQFLPAQYKSTKISSEFFYYLTQKAQAYLEIKKNARIFIPAENKGEFKGLTFNGAFYDSNNDYYVLYNLFDSQKDKNIGTVELKLKKEFIDRIGLEILPDNAKIAVADNKIFSAGDLENSSIKIKAWTNKGTENLIFTEGEEVKFYVKTNRDGYITLLYHLAGKNRIRTPLKVNMHVSPEQINKDILFETFEVYPPFGSETAQFIFSTNELTFFTETVVIEGVEYEVLKEDYEQFMLNTRGLKKQNKMETAETYLSITTIRGGQ